MKRLLIVEDDPGIRETLADFFGSREFIVDEVASSETAHERLDAHRYACVLLDLRLPDEDGLSLLRALRSRGDRTPVIAVTARGEEQQRIAGLELGADDYVVKPFSVRELAARVDAVLRRTAVADLVTIGQATIDFAALELRRNGDVHALQPKEAELLRYLLTHVGRAVERAEILREVWGYDAFPTTRTVDTHVFNLRRKLEEYPDRPEHLVTVHGVGYRLVPDA